MDRTPFLQSAAALNATSHFLWGERAGRQNAYSLKYTGTGFVANYGASIFRALFYEALGGSKRRTPARALVDGALIPPRPTSPTIT